jgi:hypothetical protein
MNASITHQRGRRADGQPISSALMLWVVRRQQPLGFFGLAALTTLAWWPYFSAPLHLDAGGYALAAYWWARGETLYADLSITRPQGIFVIFRLLQAIGLGDARGVHIAGAACCFLCALALRWIAGRVWGATVGLVAASLFSLLVPALEGGTVNAELFMLLPLLLGLAALIAADGPSVQPKARLALLALSGVLAAAALLVKPAGVVAVPLALAWIVRRGWQFRHRGTAAVEYVVFLVAFAVGLLPAFVHGLITVPDRYLHDVYLYRVGQDSVAANGFFNQAFLLVWNSLYVVARVPILLLAGVGLWLARYLPASQRDLLWLWMATALTGVALGGNWFPHYFQQVLPPAAVAVAVSGQHIIYSMRSWWRIALQGFGLTGIVQLVVVAASLYWPSADSGKFFVSTEYPLYTPSATSAALGAYIRERTTPDERIYVVYSNADLYYLIERRPAARWLYPRELGLIRGAFDEQVARIANPRTAPAYIIAAQPLDAFGLDPDGALRAVVARDYQLETTIGGLPIYRRGK